MFNKQDVKHHQYLGEDIIKQDKVSKCKLVSDGGAGPHQSGSMTGVILWSGKHHQEVFKE